jgi:hypothetical protein
MERRSCSSRQSWGHRSVARGCSFSRTSAEIGVGCGLAELPHGFGAHRGVAGHHRADIGRISRSDLPEDALDFGPGIAPSGRPGCQRPSHHDPGLIAVGGHHTVTRSGEAGQIGAREVFLANRSPPPPIDLRHSHPAFDVDRSVRRWPRTGRIVRNPTVGVARRDCGATRRLCGAATATGVWRPVWRVVAGIVAAVIAPSPPPGVVIAVRTPADVARPPGPVHPRGPPVTTPRPHPAEADREMPRAVVMGQPAPGLVGDPGPTGRGPIPPAGPVRLPAPAHSRLPGPGVDVVDVDPAAVVVELGRLA